MSNSVNHNHANNSHSHGLLRSAIESMHHMFLAISTRLRHLHIRNRKQMEHAKGHYDLWDKLGSHIEQMPVEETPDEPQEHLQQTHQNKESSKPHAPIADERKFKDLRKYFVRKAILEHHPHMDEKMCASTMHHINLALHLARKGDKDGSKVHIHLAESAMHTASRFMSHDDYEAFELQIELRLKDIIENSLLPINDS